mmetsp:Transcript_25053/g.54926  ORF Transcript_25053/g.54926 Transcript_25053/m.54926 type:complete len:262 (+) Transcript_25053:503-1288(+)
MDLSRFRLFHPVCCLLFACRELTNWWVFYYGTYVVMLLRYLIIDVGNLLFDVFLVVFLGPVKIRSLLDRHELAQGPELLASVLDQLLLFLRVVKDGRTVLGSGPAGIGGCVHIEKELQHLLVRPLVLVESDPDGLGVVLDVPVRGVLRGGIIGVPRGAPRIAHDRFDDALLAIEIALRTPESSHGCLEGCRDVLGGRNQGADLAGFFFHGVYHVVAAFAIATDDDAVIANVADASAAGCLFVARDGRNRKEGFDSGCQNRR